jgi:hypothetical protein
MKIIHLKKRYKIIFGFFLFISLLLFTFPRIARWYIVKHGPVLIGRDVAIDKIRLNYFTGTLRIQDLRLFESDSKTVFLSFKRLKIKIDYLPLFKNEYLIKYISLDDPYFQVLQNGEKFNFSDLTAADKTDVTKDTLPAEPAKYIINNIQINRGYVKYTDVNLSHTIALNNLDLVIPGFTWNSDSTKLDVDFRFVDGGRLYSRLDMNQSDSTYSVRLKLDSLNLDIIEPYIKSNMYISAMHGYLTNDLFIKGNMQSVMQLFVRGVNHVYGFQLIDTLNRSVFSAKDLTVDIDTLELQKNRISLKYIGLTDPFILFEMIDTTNNWLSLVKPSAIEQSDSLQQNTDTTSASPDVSFDFSKLRISGGKVKFNDKTLRYPFEYNIDNINIESSSIPDKPGKFSLSMTAGLNGTGNFKADATLNSADFNDLDLALSIEQFRMKDVDAYFKHYFGFPVTGGIMNFHTEDRMRTSSLVSSNSLYFRRFTLSKSKLKESEYHIPLRLALGVLSDKDGVIDLKAPVETKGDEVKVKNLRKIVFRIIGNLFVKAAVSPFNMLAGLYKVDPAELEEIKLGLTDPAPDDKNLKSVDIIADILNKKPALNVDFYYCIDLTRATDSLAYLMAVEDYINYKKSRGINIVNIPDSALIRYLADKQASESMKNDTALSVLTRNYIGNEKLEKKLDSIKALQTGFIANYLSHDKEIPSERFRIIGTAPDTIKPAPNYPSFRTYFTTAEENQE